MPLYEYRCECGRGREDFRSVANRDHAPKCHGDMHRVMSVVRQINAPTGAALRSNYQLFTEASQELDAAGVNTTEIWNHAKSKANAMVAAGEAPPLPTQ